MSEALSFDQTENIVLHYLAASSEPKSAREIQEALGVIMVQVTRALMNAKNRKPALVSVEQGGKYKFIGNREALDPVPEEYLAIIGEPVSQESNEAQEEAYEASSSDDSLGPVDQQILELLTVKKKVPLSGIIRQFKLEDDEASDILQDLESKDLLVKEHIDDFDEDCFTISSKGKDLIERVFNEPAGSNVYPIKKTSSKEDSSKSQKPSVAPQEASMTGSLRKFNIPSFDNIPEENASSRGRPTGDRDYENLRVCMLGYIEEHQPCAKSNISRTLARLLSNFGRQTIIEEVDSLVSNGYVQAEISGKREVFSLTDAGQAVVNEVRAGNSIGPIGSEEQAGKGSKSTAKAASKPKATTAAKPKAAAPASKPAQSPAPTPSPVSEPATHVAQQEARPAPSAPMQAPRASMDSDLSGRVNQLIQSVSGENAYELRYCFDQLLERVSHLERSNEYLKKMNKGLIDEI